MNLQESLFAADPVAPEAGTQSDAALPDSQAPLAERLRPRTLDEVIGQAHLLGPGKPLRVVFASSV